MGLSFGQGICVGGGGMLLGLSNAPNEKGPKKHIGEAIKELANNIKDKKSAETKYVLPMIPYLIYKFVAHRGWRHAAKGNGIKAKDLGLQRTYRI
ncbi:hypothetical protein [Lachnoclostridium phytofermentans]|uniref:Uncharacterized protein n=1 Tax=Lachnoclostridium phytofermentans (strain ATCC 700394 / DSM 18823 / ISDg) TaxID=357809 RepID=A9KM32_LACP7|nr:hypothetical protein [Lachnoclostridium phytofermentans]ABX41375.1 conserved hypothetical protein [Lachnoclostridium phytofermentans ISDg]